MKNSSKCFLLFVALTFLLLGTDSVFGAAPGVSEGLLWQKAVAIATANKYLTPGQMVVTTEELDNQQKVVHSEETWIHFFLGTSSQVENEILKALENGKDVTAERRQKAKTEQAKKEKKRSKSEEKSVGVNPFEEIPFSEEKQGMVSVTRLNLKESVLGHHCEVFEYSMSKDKKAFYKGKAWLEEESGVPVQIRYTPSPLPKNVTRMETVAVFTNTGNQFFPSEIKVEGSGGFLFIKKNMRMTMKLSDFWSYRPKSETESR